MEEGKGKVELRFEDLILQMRERTAGYNRAARDLKKILEDDPTNKTALEKLSDIQKKLLSDISVLRDKTSFDNLLSYGKKKEIEFINTLVDIRKKKGLSQAEIAGRLKMKRPALSRLESGKHSPSMKLLVAYAGVLGYEVGFKFK